MSEPQVTPEKWMYEPLARAFEARGFTTFKQLRFHHPLVREYGEYHPKADLAAFRWVTDAQIDAVAVEAKPGKYPDSPLWATSQATTYQLLFPSVYVASHTPPEGLAFSEGVLRALGLGYIQVAGDRAIFVFSPVPKARCYEMHYLEHIRPVALMALLAKRFITEKWRANTYPPRSFWVWTEALRTVQLQFGVDEQNAYFGCYSDIKDVCRKVAQRADVREIALRLARIPEAFERHHTVEYAERLPGRQLDYARCGGQTAPFDDTPDSIEAALKQARDWCQPSRRVGALSMRVKLWKRERFVERPEAEASVQQLWEPVNALRAYLNSLIGA